METFNVVIRYLTLCLGFIHLVRADKEEHGSNKELILLIRAIFWLLWTIAITIVGK